MVSHFHFARTAVVINFLDQITYKPSVEVKS